MWRIDLLLKHASTGQLSFFYWIVLRGPYGSEGKWRFWQLCLNVERCAPEERLAHIVVYTAHTELGIGISL